MLDAAIEVGIATYLAKRGASDDDVEAALAERGVNGWLARRLVVFLPVAFGRRLLADARLSEELSDGGTLRRLDDDRVFAAARVRAERASRDEIEAIGLRSSEIHAVNSALNAGSRLQDLLFSPVTLARPLPPEEQGDGGVPSPHEAFVALLEGHGVSDRLAFDARVFPRLRNGLVMVQVDFVVSHPALAVPTLLESFGGVGGTWRDAIHQTIDKFERGSLHPLIAGLVDRTSCADQVTWEPLDHPTGGFELCMGGQLVLYAKEPVPDLRPLVDSVKLALSAVPVSSAVHALRLFVCWDQGALVSTEALLDNQPWPAGVDLLTRYGWPHTAGLWGCRLFMLVLPCAR